MALIKKSVRSGIQKQFNPDLVEQVELELMGADFPLINTDSGKERIQLAIIYLANGDSEKIHLNIRHAHRDWRDILVSAGLGDSNWTDMLKKRGVDME